MHHPRRKYSRFSVPDIKGRLGDLIITVDKIPAHNSLECDNFISGNFSIPSEVRDAVEMWLTNAEYASLELTEFLSKMFDPEEYRKGNL